MEVSSPSWAKVIVIGFVYRVGQNGTSRTVLKPLSNVELNKFCCLQDMNKEKFPIILDQKTVDNLWQPIPERTNVVVSADKDWQAPEGFIRHWYLSQAILRLERCYSRILVSGYSAVVEALESNVAHQIIFCEMEKGHEPVGDELPHDLLNSRHSHIHNLKESAVMATQFSSF